MKNTLVLFIGLSGAFLLFSGKLSGQTQLNTEISYLVENGTGQGASLGFEYEKYYGDQFSLPVRLSAGYLFMPDYNSLSIELHKGFRKYFSSGFFAEQYLGIGMMANFYKVESIWYYDRFSNIIRYKDGANWGFMPSVTLGGGYNITHKKGTSNYIWIRPKIYWNLGFRGLAMPYSSVQIGFTHQIKSSK